MQRVERQCGVAFQLLKTQLLTVTDLEGEQVADLVAFNSADPREYLSSGRSIDYAKTIYLTTGNVLYSNRSRPLLTSFKPLGTLMLMRALSTSSAC